MEDAFEPLQEGEESELRAIFDNPHQLEKVAKGLGVEADDLESLLAAARGEIPSEPMDAWRLVGWEDRPPLDAAEAVFPPRVGRNGRSLRGAEPDAEPIRPGSRFDLERLTALAKPDSPPRAKAIVLSGTPGTGRTATLRAMTARLLRSGAELSWWPRADGEVLVVDDFDQLPHSERKKVGDLLFAHSKPALVATGSGCAHRELPKLGAFYELLPADREWSERFIDHLETLLRAHVDSDSSLESLRKFMEEDPFAMELCSRPDIIGCIARSISEGRGSGAVRRRQLEVFLGRAVERLRARRRDAEASFFEARGREALGLLMEKSDAGRASHEQVVDAWGEAGRGDGVGALGVHSLIEAAVDASLLSRVEASYVLRPPQLGQMALGWRLARALETDATEEAVRLVEHCVLQPEPSGALACAGESLTDLAPLLEVFEALPASLMCQAFPGVTRLLGCEVRCSEPKLFARWYVRAVAWWMMWPASPKPAPVRTQEVVWRERLAVEADISGLAPLVVLGVAARRHAGALEGLDLTREMPGVLDADLHLYIAAVGGKPAWDEDRWQLTIAAWGHVEEPQGFWDRVRGKLWNARTGPFDFLTDHQLEAWLAYVAGPSLLRTPEGRRRLAGLADITIDTFLGGQGFAACHWVDALVDQLDIGAAGAEDAFAEAMELGLENLSKRSQKAIFDVWERSEDRRDGLGDAVMQRLSAREPELNWPNRTTWKRLLQTALKGRTGELTREWVSRGRRYVPWHSLVEAGADAVDIARWVALTEPSEPDDVDPGLWSEVKKAKAFLLDLRRPDVLGEWLRVASTRAREERALALTSRDRLVEPPLEALARLSDDTARRTRIRLCVEEPMSRSVRVRLLLGLIPRSDEVESWGRLSERAAGILEQSMRMVQLATARATSEGMDAAARALDDLADWLSDPETAFDESGGQFLSLFSDGSLQVPSPEAWAEWVGREKWTLLREILACLDAATDRGVDAVQTVVEVLHRRSELWPWPYDPRCASFLALICRHLGWDAVSELLRREAQVAGERLSYGWGQLRELDGFEAWHSDLLDDEHVAPAAARLLARVKSDRAIKMLEERPLIRGSKPDSVSLELALGASGKSPGRVLDILERRLSRGRREARRAWWEAVLLAMPRRHERARVSRRLFEASDVGARRSSERSQRKNEGAP